MLCLSLDRARIVGFALCLGCHLLIGCGESPSIEQEPPAGQCAAEDQSLDSEDPAVQTESTLSGRWWLSRPGDSSAVPRLLEFQRDGNLTYLTKPEEETEPYEEVGSWYLLEDGRIEIGSDFFGSGMKSFRWTVESDQLMLDGKFTYVRESTAAGMALARAAKNSAPVVATQPSGTESKPAMTASRREAEDGEERAKRMTRQLVGHWRLEGDGKNVRLPPLLQFEADGTLRYPASEDAERPNELVAGSFEISPDDAALRLDCDWFIDASNSFGGGRFRPDGKALTPDGRYARFILNQKHTFVRVTPAEFAAIASAKPVVAASRYGGANSPAQPEIVEALHRLKAGDRLAIALTGDVAPGTSDQARYGRFGTPVGSGACLAFSATLDRGSDPAVKDGNGKEGIFGGEFGRMTTLLRTGTAIPDGPARGAHPLPDLTRFEVAAPTRNRWIDSLFTPRSDTKFLSVGNQGLVLASGSVTEANRGRESLLVSITPQVSSADDSFHVFAIGHDTVAVSASPGNRPIDTIRFVHGEGSSFGFLTSESPLTLVSSGNESPTYSFDVLPSLPGLASGETLAEIVDLQIDESWLALHGRVRGTGVTASNDDAIWCGNRGRLRLAVREGNVPPDFVTIAPKIVEPRLLAVDGSESGLTSISCRLRTGEETQPGGGTLLSATLEGTLVAHVWGSSSLHNRDVSVEHFVGSDWAQILVSTNNQTKRRGLIRISDRGSADQIIAAQRRTIAERTRLGNTPSASIRKALMSKAPRGPNPPPLTWRIGQIFVPAEERRLTRTGVSSEGIEEVMSVEHAYFAVGEGPFVRYHNPKEAKPIPATIGGNIPFVCLLDVSAPGLPVGTRLTSIEHFDNRWLIGELNGIPTARGVWEVETSGAGSTGENAPPLSALVLVGATGQTIEARPGDRRRIASIGFNPRRAVCNEPTGDFRQLPEVTVFTLAFDDGSEGIFVQRTAARQFVPVEQRPLGTGVR
jgi:hypothetical protein